MIKELHNTWIKAANDCHLAHINKLKNPTKNNRITLGLAIQQADNCRRAYLQACKDLKNDVRLAA